MSLPFLLKGIGVGFAVAAPVGPIGVLCIRRSLGEGRQIGLATGLGAATADAAYGCIAGFGLTAVSGFLVRQQLVLSLIGGLFLCYLGIRTLMSKPPPEGTMARCRGWPAAYFSTLAYTLCNPMTLFSFVGIFAGLGLGASRNFLGAGSLVAGVFIGSASWWLLLSSGVSSIRDRISVSWMRAVNRLSGGVIFAFGLWSLARLFPG